MSNTRYRNLLFIVGVLLVTNIAMLVYFVWLKEPEKGSLRNDRDRHGPGMSDFLQKELQFSKEQMAAFDTLKKQQRAAMRPLFEDLGRSKDSLYQLVGSTSEPAVSAAAATVGKRQEALELRFFENFRAIRNICTDSQRPTFDSLAPAIIRRMMSPQRKPGGPAKKVDSTKAVR
jgi:protein CpxP